MYTGRFPQRRPRRPSTRRRPPSSRSRALRRRRALRARGRGGDERARRRRRRRRPKPRRREQDDEHGSREEAPQQANAAAPLSRESSAAETNAAASPARRHWRRARDDDISFHPRDRCRQARAAPEGQPATPQPPAASDFGGFPDATRSASLRIAVAARALVGRRRRLRELRERRPRCLRSRRPRSRPRRHTRLRRAALRARPPRARRGAPHPSAFSAATSTRRSIGRAAGFSPAPRPKPLVRLWLSPVLGAPFAAAPSPAATLQSSAGGGDGGSARPSSPSSCPPHRQTVALVVGRLADPTSLRTWYPWADRPDAVQLGQPCSMERTYCPSAACARWRARSSRRGACRGRRSTATHATSSSWPCSTCRGCAASHTPRGVSSGPWRVSWGGVGDKQRGRISSGPAPRRRGRPRAARARGHTMSVVSLEPGDEGVAVVGEGETADHVGVGAERLEPCGRRRAASSERVVPVHRRRSRPSRRLEAGGGVALVVGKLTPNVRRGARAASMWSGGAAPASRCAWGVQRWHEVACGA